MIVAPSEISFRPNHDNEKPPPSNIEAEEAILGGIILDPFAIERIAHVLRPEHFYVSVHKDIYRACVKLFRAGKHANLLELTSFLTDKNILLKVGGRNKLAELADRTVSAVNIDALAELVIEKYTRRKLIEWGDEVQGLAQAGEYELEEIMAILGEKSNELISTPHVQTKEDTQRHKHNRILKELRRIYTSIADPSFRFFVLKELAQYYGYSPGFLEQLYLKSLTGECSKLLSYEELKELGGSEVREWLLNGLVPKASTILLAADGGIGKTKLVYLIAKYLTEGKDFGDFTATGKRKILYYQGDESPGDMVQALEMMGYSAPLINQNVKIRFGWSAENMPTLIQDIQEFQPDFVMIDSLSTANKFSTYKESDMEYARPLLEMAGLAATSGCTFLIVHHTNKEGGVRGTTAIRNAVSEVWSLTGDNSLEAVPNDRILEINKSRSRSSGKKYRLFFDDEQLNFTYLGEGEEDKSTSSTREAIRDFLRGHRNVRFTAEEIAHTINRSYSTVRKIAGTMGADGIISKIITPGKANLYYLDTDCITETSHLVSHPEKINSNPDTASVSFNVTNITIPPPIPPLDSPQNSCETSDSARGGIVNSNFEVNQTFSSENFSNCEKPSHHPTLGGNPDDTEAKEVGYQGGIPGGMGWDTRSDTALIENEALQSVTEKSGMIAPDKPQPHSSFNKNKTKAFKVRGVTGQWEVKYDFGDIYIEATITTPQMQKLHYKDFCKFNEELTFKKFKDEVKDATYDLEYREMLQGKTFEVKVGRVEPRKGIVHKPVSGCTLELVQDGGMFIFKLPHGGGYYSTFDLDEFMIEEEPDIPSKPIYTMHETAFGPVQVVATKVDDQQWELLTTPPIGRPISKTITDDSQKDIQDIIKQQVIEWYQKREKPLKVGDIVKYVGSGRPHLKSKTFTVYEIDLTGVSLHSSSKTKLPIGGFKFHELAVIEAQEINDNQTQQCINARGGD